MRRELMKILALLTSLILVSINTMTTLVYAVSNTKDDTTNEENVLVSVYVKESTESYFDIDSEQYLSINVTVNNTGYLKDGIITLEDTNFKVSNLENDEVKNIAEKEIDLNTVDEGTPLSLLVPVKFNKTDRVNLDYFKKENKLTFTGTYVNNKGKEKEVKKTITQDIDWNTEAEYTISQKLVRYLKYDDANTMVTIQINDGIKDNKLPIVNKSLVVEAPKLSDQLPSKVIVTGDGITYDYRDGKATISKVTPTDNDKTISWNNEDTYFVTYIYGVQGNISSLTSKIEGKANTITGELQGSVSEDIAIRSEVGTIIETSVSGQEEISKGYLITNTNKTSNKYETNYDLTYTMNFGYVELIDKAIITENPTIVNNNTNVTSAIKTKKVSVDGSNLAKTLGDSGEIIIKSSDGTELGKLNKDNLSLDVDTGNVVIETSKPIAAGNLNVNIKKQINSENDFSLATISSFKTMTTEIKVEGIRGETTISSKLAKKEIRFKEPSSNASIDINVDNLSTVLINEDVVLTATLFTSSVDDRLYKDPSLTITLPEKVTSFKVKDARLLYENELVPTNYSTGTRSITIDLKGTQTTYNSNDVTKGTVVRVVADIGLDNLATSSNEKVKLSYTNNSSGVTKETEDTVNVVAQTGFVTIQSITANGSTLNAQGEGNEESIIKVNANSAEQTAHISGTIVNNLEETSNNKDAKGFAIVGRIPYSGNKSLDGSDLSSSINTKLKSAVTTSLSGAAIYYSSNVNEEVGGSGWKTSFDTDSKAFKIVSQNGLPNRTKMTFSYDVTIPNNVDYSKNGKATYGVYYNNDSINGASQNLIVAKTVGIKTGDIPDVKMSISAVNKLTNEDIANGGTVSEGDIVSVKVQYQNSGSENGTGLKTVITLPEGLKFVNTVTDELTSETSYNVDKNTTRTKTIPTIPSNGSTTYSFDVKVTQRIASIHKYNSTGGVDEAAQEEAKKLNINFKLSGDKIETQNADFLIKNSEGKAKILLSASKYKNLEVNEKVKITATVENAGGTKNNFKLTVKLPNGLEYVGTKYASNYNKEKGTVEINIGTIGPSNKLSYLIDAKVVSNESKELTVSASAKYDGAKADVTSNDCVLNQGAQENKRLIDITAKTTSNVGNKEMLDTDNLEYYIDITNNGSTDALLKITDILPKGVSTKSYTLVNNGKTEVSGKAGELNTTFTLKAGKSARATITASAIPLEEGSFVTYTNAPTIEIANTETKINVNSIETIVKGTGTGKGEVVTQVINNDNSITKTVDNKVTPTVQTTTTTQATITNAPAVKLAISGAAWFDKDYDGVKDLDEAPLSGITLKLFDRNNNSVARNEKNEEITTKTVFDGSYSFKDLNPGKYFIVAYYDSNSQDITTYRVANSLDSENCDFVEAKEGETTVAATDDIILTNTNAFNINLGLSNKKTFHLKLENLVKKITITNTNADTEVYEFNKNLAKVEVDNKSVETATAIVEYNIRITNVGQVAGYAKSIVDYIPSDMTFNSELNPNWYVGSDKNGYNTSLSSTKINPGETKDITLILTKKLTADNTGIERNVAEIYETYNEYGIVDTSATSGNKKDGEEDMASSDAAILVSTGKETASITGIAIGILAIISLAVYEIKKRIINNLYSDII